MKDIMRMLLTNKKKNRFECTNYRQKDIISNMLKSVIL